MLVSMEWDQDVIFSMEWDQDVLSLESIILELEYLTDHAPETRADCIAFLCQEAWDAIATAPLASAAAGPQSCAHWEGHVRYLHLHPEPFKPFQQVWVCYLPFSAFLCHNMTYENTMFIASKFKWLHKNHVISGAPQVKIVNHDVSTKLTYW